LIGSVKELIASKVDHHKFEELSKDIYNHKIKESKNIKLITDQIDKFKSHTMTILDKITDDLKIKMNSTEAINQIGKIESLINELQSAIGMNEMKIES